MPDTNKNISDLLYQHLQGNPLTAEQDQLLNTWLETDPSNKQTWSDLQNETELKEYLTIMTDPIRPQKAFNLFEQQLPVNKTSFHRTYFLKTAWLRYAAAIIVMFGIGTAVVVYLTNSQKKSAGIAVQALRQIAPGTNKATLTWGDGETINLTDAKNGILPGQSGLKVTKTADGQIVYESVSSTHTDSKENRLSLNSYNTITTPRGGEYQVVLPDGTKVWLNAASSLKYPALLNSTTDRKVELNGEAYFEVAKDKARPFIVISKTQEVEVLGTHFNINSYVDEGITKTTLLEGGVSVSGADGYIILKPGQQSALSNSRLTAYSVDVEEVVAWKNGYFQFNESNLGSIMRQLSRWYNIDVVFESNSQNELFHFKVPRNLNLAEVLKIFETNGINFKIEGGTLIVKS